MVVLGGHTAFQGREADAGTGVVVISLQKQLN